MIHFSLCSTEWVKLFVTFHNANRLISNVVIVEPKQGFNLCTCFLLNGLIKILRAKNIWYINMEMLYLSFFAFEIVINEGRNLIVNNWSQYFINVTL